MDGKGNWEAAQREAIEISQALSTVITPSNTAIGQTAIARIVPFYNRK
jgi:hypothetical protein